MVIYDLVPGSYAIHKPTGQKYRITEFDAGRFTGRTEDGATITADVDEFEAATNTPAPVLTEPAKPRDGMLLATAQRISDLQEQVNALQKKLQSVENERNTAEKMLAELAAASAPPPQPVGSRILVWTCRDMTDKELGDQLSLGWGILHIQFVGDKLNVVLQREEDDEDPPQPEARAAAPQPAPVRTVTGTVVQPEPAPAPERQPAGVFAEIIRQHHLPIAERIQMMNERILDDVLANSAARNSQPFQHRPLITNGGI